MTWKITLELDCTHTQAQTVFDVIANWAHEGHPIELPDITRWSPAVTRWFPAVSLEPHTAMREADDDTERRLHARAAVDTHRARGGRIL